jgi:DNA-binding transcriptional ArsR family regulator/uncharacterized protein YndB with AHSA1/START domain
MHTPEPSTPESITQERSDTQRLLDALNSRVRREILWLIWERELPAGQIAAAFDLAAPTISEHLWVLRDAGLVELRSKGTFRWYRARKNAIKGIRGLLSDDEHKWFPGTTPAPMAPSTTVGATVVTVNGSCSQSEAFRAFTDPMVYSRWAGVPVTLADGRFAATMEWGLEVRGTYEYVVEPSLIVMSWDFGANNVPVPGDNMRAYLEIARRGRGCHLELTQLVRSAEQAAYMERAWGVMLGRFRDHVRTALNDNTSSRMRPKRTRSTP